MTDAEKQNPGDEDRPAEREPGGFGIATSFRDFAQYTTAHGLGRFAAQSTGFGRAIWIAFLLGTYGGFSYHLFTLIDRFTSTPLLTSLATSLPYEFPDVYICPKNPISMSKAYEPFKLKDLQKLRGLSKDCKTSCQAKLSYFKESDSFLSTPMYAFAKMVSDVESVLMPILNDKGITGNTSQCRFTLDGTEYIGNKSSVPVFGNSMRLVRPPANLTQPPYVTELPCLAWNEAANRLNKSGLGSMSDKILAFNFSNDDARCRTPPGLPLDMFDKFTTYLINQDKEPICYQDSESARLFSISCFGGQIPTMNVEKCTECCYKNNYKFYGLQYYDCFCANSIDETNKKDSDNCIYSCPGQAEDAEETCGGDGLIMSVKQIRPAVDLPIFGSYGGFLADYLIGPYCFYMDPVNGLALSYCNIPFCSAAGTYDCVVSSTDNQELAARQSSKYTGSLNYTYSGRECMVWDDVKTAVAKRQLSLPDSNLISWTFPFLYYSIDQMIILTTDYAISNRTNYCRAAHVLYDATYYSETGSDRVGSSRSTLVSSLDPGCFYVNEEDKEVHFELCAIDSCVDASPSVPGIVRNSIGTAQLARQFGPSLDIGLVDCSFYNWQCTVSNFQEVLHPESGVCYRFMKEPFIKGLSLPELTEATLDVQLFTDATDSAGIGPKDAHSSAKAILNELGDSRVASNNAYVVIVPHGAFPWMSKAFGVVKAQKSEFKVRLDKTTRFSKPSQECSTTASPVTYVIDYWKPAGLPSNVTALMESTFWVVYHEQNWTAKIDLMKQLVTGYNAIRSPTKQKLKFETSTQEDCLNEFVLRKFAENCGCLPTFLPITVQLYDKYPICFNSTSIENLYETDQCFIKQKKNVKTYRVDARDHCLPPCETRKYTVSQNSFPWPNVRRQVSQSFLRKLAKVYGYPNRVKSLRGPGVIYSAYLQYMSLRGNTTELMNFDYQLLTLQDELAMVSVSAAQMFGEEIAEEEAYPTKNLLADMGGILGLWCGVSILTVCELVELTVYVVLTLKQFATLRQPPRSYVRGANGERDSGAAYTIPELPLPTAPSKDDEVTNGVGDGGQVSSGEVADGGGPVETSWF